MVINQGDPLNVKAKLNQKKFAKCTWGFFVGNIGFTAAHCGNPGDYVLNRQGEVIGKMEAIPQVTAKHEDNMTFRYDKIAVRLQEGYVGKNIYSGDQVLSAFHKNDDLCLYGTTTMWPKCSKNTRYNDYRGMIVSDAPVQGGDSGGVAWIPGKGLVGLITAWDNDVNMSYITPMFNEPEIIKWAQQQALYPSPHSDPSYPQRPFGYDPYAH